MNRDYNLPHIPPSKFDTLNPSEVNETLWIHAFRSKGEYLNSTSKSGKWLIFCTIAGVDAVWKKVREATELGKLGNSSKVATLANPCKKNIYERVICVYTYNADDKKDVMDIREQLRFLGINKKIPYKLNIDTQKGKYDGSLFYE